MTSYLSRRAVLAAGAGTFTVLAGCVDTGTTSQTRSDASTEPDSSSPPAGDRPTQTPRDPTPLDVTGAWAQYGFDAGHRGVTSVVGVPADGTVCWHLRRIRSGQPVLANGRLFHYAKLGRDPSGTPTVTRTREKPAGTAHPVYGNPAVLARDASTGGIAWTQPLKGPPVGWPAVGDGRVVVAVNGQLSAYRLTDGTAGWTHDLGNRPLGTPTLVDGTVVVPFNGAVDGQGGTVVQQQVRTYTLADGSRGWTVEPPKRSLRVAVGGATVVVASAGYDGTGIVTGRGLADGARRWRAKLDADFFGQVSVAGKTALVPTSENRLVALDLTTGDVRWRLDLDAGVPGVATTSETCFVADGSLRAVSLADGRERWAVSPSEGGYGGIPAVGSDAIYLEGGGFPAAFVAVSRADGSKHWSYSLPETVVEGDMVVSGLASQPVVADGGVYANAMDGLYAFGPR